MGRAERRLAAKKQPKTSIKDVRNFDIDMLMTCFALSERRLYRFGKKRIARSIGMVTALMDDIISGKATLEDYKNELEKDAKVILRAKVK